MNSDFIIKNIIFLFIFQIFARTILKKYNDKSEKKHIEDIFKKKYFSNIANQVLENINNDSDGKKGSRKNIFTKISDVNNFIKSKYNEDYIIVVYLRILYHASIHVMEYLHESILLMRHLQHNMLDS